MARRRWKKRDRSVLPVLSMFIFGLFMVLGASPGSLLFDDLVNAISPYVQVAFLIALIIAVYLLYDQVYVPLQHIYRAYRWGGVMAIVSLLFAFLGGYYLLVDQRGMLFFLISLVLWKISVHFSY